MNGGDEINVIYSFFNLLFFYNFYNSRQLAIADSSMTNRGLLVIYKSIADKLRLRLNSSDFNIGSPLPGEKKTGAGVQRGAHDHPQKPLTCWWKVD